MSEIQTPFKKINWLRFLRGTHFLNFEEFDASWFYFFSFATRKIPFAINLLPKVEFEKYRTWIQNLFKINDWTPIESRKTQCQWISISTQTRLLYFWTQAHCDGIYLLEAPDQCLVFGQKASHYYVASANFEYLASEPTSHSLAFQRPELVVVLSALVEQFNNLEEFAK